LGPRGLPFLCIAGRLAPGTTRAQAEAELDVLFQGKLAQLDPRRVAGGNQSGLLPQKIGLTPAGTGFGGLRAAYEQPVTVLMAMVAVLLVIACANVAGLLLARGSTRVREFAMRAALGASRRRLACQMITESLLLAACGGLLGIGLARAGTGWLGRYLGYLDLGVDGRVMLFVVLTIVLAGLFFGLLPAWHLSRVDLATATRKNGSGSLRLNNFLVVSQVALAFVLCVAATLLVRTFQRLSTGDIGFQRQQSYLARLDFDRQAKPAQRLELSRRLLEELRALPGIEATTVFQGISLLSPVAIENKFAVTGAASSPDAPASVVVAGPDFFRTMGLPLVRGRDFEVEQKRSAGIQPMIIGEWSARKLFGTEDPIGRRIKLWAEFEIVGVARDIKYGQLREDDRFVFYVPAHTRPSMLQTMLAIRMRAGGAPNLADLRAVLRRLDASAGISEIRPLTDSLANQSRQERFTAQLAGFFGAFVLLLACLGLYGLLSFGVTRRTREFGVRVALGASPRGLHGLILRQGMRLVMLGVVLGAAGAIGTVRLARSLLFGVSATEPSVYLGVFFLLLVAAAGACWLPARRASRVDPMVALRAE
jgi:predicted permease